MTMKILNPLEIPNWNEKIAELPGATIFHTANWARVLVETYNYTPRYFCTFSNNQLTSLIPMMEINSWVTGKRGVSLPFSDQVEPLITDKGEFDHLLNAMLTFGQKKAWKTLSFHGGHGLFDTAKACQTFISCVVSLETDSTSLFKSFKSSTRRNIKKAQKAGVTTKISHSQESMKAFYRLNCMTRRDHGLPPQPLSFFENVYRHIIYPELGFVCLSFIDGRVVSGVVYFHFDGNAVYKYGASDKRYLQFRPNNLVFWEALAHSCSISCHAVDLGRTELAHKGLLQFKRGWNTQESDLHYFKFDPRGNAFITNKTGLQSSYPIFRFLPIPVLKVLGSVLYRHVG